MPHSHGRYQQDLGFTDGIIEFNAAKFTASTSGGSLTLTRNAAGDFSYIAANSTTGTLSTDILSEVLARTGFFEDTQNIFGSTFGGGLGGSPAGPGGAGPGIPASAEPQGRPDSFILPGQPQPASAMSTLQAITPRTALKLKGIKPLSIAVIYQSLTADITTLTCRLDAMQFKGGAANVITNLLASGANGLTKTHVATTYVITVPIPNAVFYQVQDLQQLWFEISLVTPGGGTMSFYGIRLQAEFNYN